MTTDEVVDNFYSLAPKYRTKKNLKEMLEKEVYALKATIGELHQEIRERNERE